MNREPMIPGDGRAPDPSKAPSEVTFADVEGAARRLRGVAHRTPVLRCGYMDGLVRSKVHLKCENFQRVGAFKFRGAYNAMRKLGEGTETRGHERTKGEGPAGVLTWSSGNHAQAVALAGRLLGIATVIVMPSDAPRVKLEATREYLGDVEGSEIVLYDREKETREELGTRLAHERGLEIVPPYDHPDVIAGQGTVGMELIEQSAGLDVLFLCVGGGGLLSGCAIAAKAMEKECTVVGVEPELADDATRSFRSGTLQTVHNPTTIADGARTPSLGRWTFPLVMQNVDDMLTVSEAEIIGAMRMVWERVKIVCEPTGALALAGLLKVAREDPARVRGKRVGVVISGGNIDLDVLPDILAIGAAGPQYS